MIVDQLFTPKPLKEGGPYDLPGKDYDRPGDTPRRPRGEHNPYPYSKEEDDDHFREIFRKKREAAKKAEQSKLAESMLLEDPVYRNFKVIGRYIAERKLTEPEILKVFADAEAGMTDKATGANRTFLGRGKDTTMDFAGGVADALKGVWSGIQSSTPISLVDVAYNKATDSLADLTGGQKGVVMQAINKYRMLAKEYPKTAGLAKGALVAITGLATGGAGLPAVAALIYGLDAAIKGEKFSDIALKAGGAAATAWAAGKLFGGPADPTVPADEIAALTEPVGGGTYTVMKGDQGGFIAQAQGVPFKDLQAMNPDITDWTKLPVGTELQLPPSGPNTGSVWQGGASAPQGPELLGGPGAPGPAPGNNVFSQAAFDKEFAAMDADMGGVGGAAAAVPTPSPLNLQPAATPGGPQFGTVTLPDGQTLKAAAFPEGGITPRLPVGSTPVTINYNGQELTGRIVNDTVYFTKFPADAAAGTTSGAGTLSGVGGAADASKYSAPIDYSQPGPASVDSLGQKLEYGMPVNDKGSFVPPNPSLPADELAKQTAAYNSWKADFMKRFPEATLRPDGTMQPFKPGLAPIYPGMTPKTFESVKLRVLPANKLIDQKFTVLNWALNESVGKPQGRSMHLTPLGVYTVFENIRRVGEAAVEADAPWDLSTKPDDPRNLKPGDPGTITVPRRKPTAPAPAPTAPVNTTPTGPGREELPDLYRPDAPDAPYTPADPAKKSWFGKGLDYLDKGVKKVGGVIGNLGHQLTTGVTKEKLKMNWHQAGKPSDSDQLSAWLVKQGVPIGVVNGVYQKMGLPVSAEPTTPTDPAKAEPQARTGGAQRSMPFYGTNPATKKPWTYDELQAKSQAGTTPAPAPAPAMTGGPTAGLPPASGEEPADAGAGAFGNMAGQLAKGGAAQPNTMANAPVSKTNTAKPGNPNATPTTAPGATTASNPAGFNAANVMKLPGMEKYAKAPAPANFAGGPSGYGKTTMSVKPMAGIPGMKAPAAPKAPGVKYNVNLPAGGGAGVKAATQPGQLSKDEYIKRIGAPAMPESRVFNALKKPVAEMLSMVETKEDVNRIKQFIDQTFVKYGAVTESAFVVRNRLIEHVTQVGAQRRREHSRKAAH